ncbi:hypothetical protein VNO77_18724 [Canavalia gladiata]|uniref:Uncharacterized protein n=1 Tax=Canavalia gladiata TaxID=3824 RepID=A0AAN9LPT5_CANGL
MHQLEFFLNLESIEILNGIAPKDYETLKGNRLASLILGSSIKRFKGSFSALNHQNLAMESHQILKTGKLQ